jgi:hypothetical protein
MNFSDVESLKEAEFLAPPHRRDMNFPDVESLEEAEFLVPPPPPLLTDADRARHRQEQR